MWGLVVAAALTLGLVRAAVAKSAHRKSAEERRLAYLSAMLEIGRVSLDECEDGAVLARKFGNMDLEKKFRKTAATLKKGRA